MEAELLRNDWELIDVKEKGLQFWLDEAKRIRKTSHEKSYLMVCRIQKLLVTAKLIDDRDFVEIITRSV